MAIRSDEITSIIRDEIRSFAEGADVAGVGTIVEVGDGIAQVYGLSGALASELLEVGAPAPAGEASLGSTLRYDVRVQAPGTLRIDNNLATLQAGADLRQVSCPWRFSRR